MPKRRRDIIMLNCVQGLTLKQAGRRVGVGESAAHRHIAIAMKEIAEALAAEARLPAHREAAE